MAKVHPPAGRERREYKRVKSYLGNDPPIEAFRCFADMARRIQEGQVGSLRRLSTEMGFSATHLDKWLPRFAAQLGIPERQLLLLASDNRPFIRLASGGQNLVRDVERLLGAYRSLVTVNAPLPDQITCGTWQWLVAHVFTEVAARFTKQQLARRYRTGLAFFEYDTDLMLRDLSDGYIDIGLGSCEADLRLSVEDHLEPYETGITATGELIAVAPSGHRWAKPPEKRTVRFADLGRETLCLARYDLNRQFRNFRPRSAENARLVVVDNYLSVFEMVRRAAQAEPAGALVGVVPRFGVQRRNGHVIDRSLDVFKIRGMNNPAPPLAVWVRKGWQPHTEAEEFIRCTTQVVNEVWLGRGSA